MIGPARADRGRPPVGWFTKRTAEAWLRDLLDQARRGTLPGTVRTGATFAAAAAEWLRFIEEDRARKPSTLNDYRSAVKAHLLPAFGEQPLESITPEQIDAWRRGLTGLSNRSKNKLLIQLHGIFRRAQMVWGLQANPSFGAFVFGQMANDTRRAWTQNGLMQLSALLPGLCSLQPLVLGRPFSHWHVPLTLCSTAAVRSRADGSGPLAATFAVAFGFA